MDDRQRRTEQRFEFPVPGVPVVDFLYLRRDTDEKAALRDAFGTQVRTNFLKDLAYNHSHRLLECGFSLRNITTLANGRVPRGFQVHHIRPLDDGGTNDFSNLVLIRAHPAHEAVHRYLDPQIHGLECGKTRVVSLPIPEPGIHRPSPRLLEPFQPSPALVKLGCRFHRR